MPRPLPFDALDGPQVRSRWAAVLAAAIALTAWHTDWPALWDTARGLVPAAGERFDWDAADLEAAPAVDELAGLTGGVDDAAVSARLTAGDAAVDLVWEAPLALAQVRAEVYTDAYGTGVRLGVGADTVSTDAGPHCLNARITRQGETTALQWCVHAVQHPPVDTGAWAPDRLYLTQTANLAPPEGSGPSLVDYFGFGAATGDAFETGLWPDGMWRSEHTGACERPGRYLHLTGRYADPAAHQRSVEVVEDAGRAFPAEGRLLSPACVAVATDGRTLTAEPFFTTAPVPLSGTAGYNATVREAREVRMAVVMDVRSCDTGLAYCTADATAADPEGWWVPNGGPGGTWTGDLLAVGR